MKLSKIFRFFNPSKPTSMKNKTITISQQVLLFEDSDILVEQKIHIDPNDGFMSLIHDGHDINLTLRNFFNLYSLVQEGIKQLDQKLIENSKQPLT